MINVKVITNYGRINVYRFHLSINASGEKQTSSDRFQGARTIVFYGH